MREDQLLFGRTRVIYEALQWRAPINTGSGRVSMFTDRIIPIRCADAADLDDHVEEAKNLTRLRNWRLRFFLGDKAIAEVGLVK